MLILSGGSSTELVFALDNFSILGLTGAAPFWTGVSSESSDNATFHVFVRFLGKQKFSGMVQVEFPFRFCGFKDEEIELGMLDTA